MKHILITGASTGIGLALAQEFHRHGYFIFGSVRKEADAERLQAAMPERFMPLLFDVTDAEAIQQAESQVREQVGQVGLAGLINNAGIATGGPLMHLPVAETRRLIEVNALGMMQVTQTFLPLLGAGKNSPYPPGKILQISSVSGELAMPFTGPYSASKFAMEALSHSLRRELQMYGINVIIIGPGPIKTPIWDKAQQEDASRFADTDYAKVMERFKKFAIERGQASAMPAEELARRVYKIFHKQKPKVRYAITPNYFNNWFLPRYVLPARMLDRAVRKMIGF